MPHFKILSLFEFVNFVTYSVFDFFQILSFWVVSLFKFMSFVTFWVWVFEFCHIFFWSRHIMSCNILSCHILGFKFCHILNFEVMSHLDFLRYVIFWVFCWIKFLVRTKVFSDFFFFYEKSFLFTSITVLLSLLSLQSQMSQLSLLSHR